VESPVERGVRAFVGISLVIGAFVLLAGGIEYGTFRTAPAWVSSAAGLLAVALAIFTAFEEPGPRSPIVPASAWIAAVLGAMAWAHVDVGGTGHAFLAGFAAAVALAAGVGILRRHLWAWPVAFASVIGFGPIVLLLAPVPIATLAGGFVLFLVDAIGLLIVHRSYFEPRR
jgi:hypothetical protein